MSAAESRLFPFPRTGSQHWRSYWTQRRENGNAETHCPDIVAEAEKLFGISYGTGSCSYNRNCRDSGDRSPDAEPELSYKSLQRLQDKEWARSIAESTLGTTSDSDLAEVLKRLNHAIHLDPECTLALQQRATLYIKQHRLSKAKADIDSLGEIHKGARLVESQEHGKDSLSETISSLYAIYRDCMKEEKAESMTKGKREQKRRKAHASSASPDPRARRSLDRSHKGRGRRHGESHSRGRSSSRNRSSDVRHRSNGHHGHRHDHERSAKRPRRSPR